MSSEKKTLDYTKVPTKEMLKDLNEEVPPTYGYGIRHVQLALFLICLTNTFVIRGHLGVTIVAMTNLPNSSIDNHLVNLTEQVIEHAEKHYEGTIRENKIYMESDKERNQIELQVKNTDKSWSIYRTYYWSKPIQEMVLGSFFLGYFSMMFPAGMICQRWGGKLPLQISLLVNGIVSIATPWIAVWGNWKAVCGCRILQGMTQAGTYPSIQTLLAKWVSSSELATMSSYLYTGTLIGNVIAFQVGGVLADSRWGWPSTFWVVGINCILSFVFLTIFGAASPEQHSYISDDEKNYILGRVSDGIVQKRTVPWKAILTSKPVWGSFATHIGSGVVFVFFFTQTPSFIHYILGINVKDSGLLSSLPYVVSFFTSVCFGYISDYLTNKKIISLKTARRISNSISQVGIAIMLILASFATSTTTAVLCLVISMGLYVAVHTGWMVNHIDLAPNFTGTIMSIGNILMNCFVLLIPVLVSNIVTDVRNPNQWRIMFGIVAALTVLCNTIFVIFVSTERQPWDREECTTSNEKECENPKATVK